MSSHRTPSKDIETQRSPFHNAADGAISWNLAYQNLVQLMGTEEVIGHICIVEIQTNAGSLIEPYHMTYIQHGSA